MILLPRFSRKNLLFSLFLISTSVWIFGDSYKVPQAIALQAFGKDDRQPMLSASYPWSAVGRVQINGGGHCTGSLVSENLVLTNAHCIFKNGELVGATFQPNYKRGSSSETIRAVEYYYETRHPDKNRAADWALIKLEKPIGQKYGWFGTKILDGNQLRNKEVTYVGYSSFDGEKVQEFIGGRTAQIHEGCRIRDFYPDMAVIHTDCDNGTGGSGGPIFIRENGKPYIIAINAADYRNASEFSKNRPPGESSFFTENYKPDLGNVGVIANRFVGSINKNAVTPPFFAPPYLPSYHAEYPMFDPRWYLNNNSDVNNACKGNLECAKQHYLANGLKECRNASRYFNPRWYLGNNPDVKRVFVDCRGASEHWSGAGRRERRPGAPGVPAP